MVAGELHWIVGSFFMRKHHQKTSPISSNPSGQNPEQKIKKQQAEDSLSQKKPVKHLSELRNAGLVTADNKLFAGSLEWWLQNKQG